MDIDQIGTGRQEQADADRERVNAILNSGQDKAILRLLRGETQAIIVQVRVLQQERREAWEMTHAEEQA
jgi:hypothetical protein